MSVPMIPFHDCIPIPWNELLDKLIKATRPDTVPRINLVLIKQQIPYFINFELELEMEFDGNKMGLESLFVTLNYALEGITNIQEALLSYLVQFQNHPINKQIAIISELQLDNVTIEHAINVIERLEFVKSRDLLLILNLIQIMIDNTYFELYSFDEIAGLKDYSIYPIDIQITSIRTIPILVHHKFLNSGSHDNLSKFYRLNKY